MDIDAMTDAYIECALWVGVAGPEPGEEVLGADRGMVTDEAYGLARDDVTDFATVAADDLAGMDPSQAGHDFFLTRNGHGAGFWDRGLGERGERLTELCKAFGSDDWYVGDDGKVYR